MRNVMVALMLACVSLVALAVVAFAEEADPLEKDVTQGALRVKQQDGSFLECPLKHTDVKGEISGFIARVKVTQTFYNPLNEKIEAVYVFPLPHGSAVDDMTMVIGERRIVGIIKKRDEARAIYEQAIQRGQTAALLEQQRPNIFTQSVGNIAPNQEINIEISYLDVLDYDMGEYTFHFPMVVGPRYNPAGFTGGIGAVPAGEKGASGQKTEVPYLKPGERNGHDISLALTLDAGVPIRDLKVANHKAEALQVDKSRAKVTLSPADAIPNKDFVLKYKVAGEKPEIAALAHNLGGGFEGSGGYFMLMIQPKIDEQLKQAPPREVCFLIDVSGSMRGQPTEKVRETMREFFKLSKPDDTFQVITFASRAAQLFPQYVPATQENVDKALNFTNAIEGGGGTEMMKGINMVLDAPVSPNRVRIVMLLTDGFIGNEAQIIDAVGKKCGDQIRFWTIGIGQAPNRFLIDGVAKQGGGMGKVLGLNDSPAALVPEIVERIHRAQLAKISIDWGKLSVFDIYPATIPELWAGRPVILFGRYMEGGADTIMIRGTAEGEPLAYPVQVALPAAQPLHSSLGTVWARKKIADLSDQMYGGEVQELVDEITRLALSYRIMSQYTSFVAVDEKDKDSLIAPATPPRRVTVPVPMPEGVSWEGVFGGVPKLALGEAGVAGRFHGIYGYTGGSGGRAAAEQGAEARTRIAAAKPAPAAQPAGAEKKAELMLEAQSAARADRPSEIGARLPSGPQLRDMPARESLRRLREDYDYKQNGRELRRGLAKDSLDDASVVSAGEHLADFIQSKIDSGDWDDPGEKDLAGKLSGPQAQKVSFEFNQTPLKDALSFLGKAAGIEIIIDPEAIAEAERTRVTRTLKDQPLHIALEAILQPTRLRLSITEGAIHIVPSPEMKAQAFFDAAVDAQDKGKLDDALALYRLTYILASAIPDWQARQHVTSSLQRIEAVRQKLAEQRIEKLPALTKRLSLVIRRQALDKAIEQIATASGIKITVLPGSIDDAKELLQLETAAANAQPEVTWLDLRNATAAQALDWLLDEFHLEWQVSGEKAQVGSGRRLMQTAPTPWVYSIGDIAFPLESELAKDDNAGNDRKIVAALREIQQAMRAMLGIEKVKLLGDYHLLVYGTAKDHAAAASYLSMLQGAPADSVPMAIGKLTGKTIPRYQARAQRRADALAAATLVRVCQAIDEYSWKLAADAIAGRANAEAVSHLQFAVENPAYAADKVPSALAARSAWAITESARLLPKDAELQELAEKVAGVAPAAAESAFKKRQLAPVEALQYVLAGRNLETLGIKADGLGEGFAKSAADLLNRPFAPVQDFGVIHAVLSDSILGAADAARKLISIPADQIRGDDLAVLYSLACRRAGKDAWDHFRRVRADITGRQPLSGAAVLITNRL